MAHISILHQDEALIVIDKPSGLLSVGYPGFRGKTAFDIVCDIHKKQGKRHHSLRPTVVHRLDRDTSGLMIFTIGEEAQKRLSENWQTMVSERLYIGLLETHSKAGKSNRSEGLKQKGTIDAPLLFNAYHNTYAVQSHARQHTRVAPQHRQNHKHTHSDEPLSAVTHYTVLHQGSQYALVQFALETGRKNQIRAHSAYLGCPIAGDHTYHATTNPVDRLALHAHTIALTHPVTKELMRFEVPAPKQWYSLAHRS